MKYYTASQAQKVLGNIKPTQLQRYVNRGILKRYTPPGKVLGLYSKEEVDALAESIHRFYEGPGKDDSDGQRFSHYSSRGKPAPS